MAFFIFMIIGIIIILLLIVCEQLQIIRKTGGT